MTLVLSVSKNHINALVHTFLWILKNFNNLLENLYNDITCGNSDLVVENPLTRTSRFICPTAISLNSVPTETLFCCLMRLVYL